MEAKYFSFPLIRDVIFFAVFSTSNHNKPVNYPQIAQQWIKESVNTACNLTAETGATKLVKALAGFKGAGGTKATAFSIVPKRPCLPESFFPPLCVKACAIPLTAVVCVCNGRVFVRFWQEGVARQT